MLSATNNRRILKNTLMLYMRQLLVLFFGLYMSRIVFKALGAVDFGIFNVVAGTVTMLGFLSNAMTTAWRSCRSKNWSGHIMPARCCLRSCGFRVRKSKSVYRNIRFLWKKIVCLQEF